MLKFAIFSMFFAGFTSVIAKIGLTGISGELGLSVRTLFVSVFVLGFAAIARLVYA
jgi:bacterial/archaeal transporter family protein